ncbi:hypothetical protein HD806DRAFT_473452 [Xylariaceae sp. AK1471]|nr:hypothetical protein HD806DRAFT_473452 [Xylariaceae sp. AK1471]
MEEFGHLSRESFERDQVFQGLEGKQYHTVSIDATPEGATSYATDCLQSDELAAFFDPRRHNLHRGDNASLRLVVITNPIHDGSGPAAPILMPKDTFLQLVDFAKVHPAALWLQLNQYDGLHYFPSATTETYYLGVSELALIWTFNASSLRTSAIAIRRRSTEGVQWIWFSQLFERHQKYIHTPMLLAYVLGLSLCCAYDHQIMWRQSRELVTIEKDVGYGKDSLKLENRVDVTTLAFAIQNIGGVLNHIANKQRHFAMIESILKAIESFTANQNESTKKYRDEIGDSNGKLIATFPSLRLRIQSSHEYLAYLKERAERLSTVVSVLYIDYTSSMFSLLSQRNIAIRLNDARRCFSEHRASRVEPTDCRGLEA